MKDELEKVRYYLDEAAARAEKDSCFSPDRNFYELWENMHQPMPFTCKRRDIRIAGKSIRRKSAAPCVGLFIWDEIESCMSLLLESEDLVEKVFIHAGGADVGLERCEPECIEGPGLDFGRKLEVFLDIVALALRGQKDIDVHSMSLVQYGEMLDIIQEKYPKGTIKAMRGLSAATVKSFISRATEDIPPDELEMQLHLPLDGNYSMRNLMTAPADDGTTEDLPAKTEIPQRTRLQVLRDLDTLRETANLAKGNEETHLISFKDAKILDCSGLWRTYEIPLDEPMPLQEGDIFSVHEKAGREKVGTFRVDIYDKERVFGRVKFADDPVKFGIRESALFACPPPSPLGMLAMEMDTLWKKITENTASPLVKKILGMDKASFSFPKDISDFPAGLDSSQAAAVKAAEDSDNPIVLIQGPPGTGKTKVLADLLSSLCRKGKRILVTAPSNTAVDNICRKIKGLPLLRFGKTPFNISRDILDKYWIGQKLNVTRFVDMRREARGGGVYAGTQVGLLKDVIVRDDVRKNGSFDAVVFDEAGMATVSEFIMLADLASRAVLFGDHKQLPPFPLPQEVIEKIRASKGPLLSSTSKMLHASALEYLAHCRGFPVMPLAKSYRCQNPRLLRFSSILFYDAKVSPSESAEYFSLPYHLRAGKYPPDTMRLVSTSKLPEEARNENLVVRAGKPGIENTAEALICADIFYNLLKKYPLEEISIISMYKRQVALIKELLTKSAAEAASGAGIPDKAWEFYLARRVATVDSFQGGESDAVIISYCRSNKNCQIGFVEDPNRINVAHTRCRREIAVVGDIECLKKGSVNDIFARLERSFKRDGVIVRISQKQLSLIRSRVLPDDLEKNH
ncbi:MAG: AAA family ATPase, partial [Victivallales bacterium]|nr:AAA family ATPase [Victivallales bacterium]